MSRQLGHSPHPNTAGSPAPELAQGHHQHLHLHLRMVEDDAAHPPRTHSELALKTQYRTAQMMAGVWEHDTILHRDTLPLNSHCYRPRLQRKVSTRLQGACAHSRTVSYHAQLISWAKDGDDEMRMTMLAVDGGSPSEHSLLAMEVSVAVLEHEDGIQVGMEAALQMSLHPHISLPEQEHAQFLLRQCTLLSFVMLGVQGRGTLAHNGPMVLGAAGQRGICSHPGPPRSS